MRLGLLHRILRQLTSGSTPASSPATLTRTSSTGASPLTMDVAFDASVAAGNLLRLQIDGNSDFSSPEQDITQLIDGSSWEAGDMTLTGLTTPSGLYYARCRIERDDGSISTWSNTITDTITASVAVLSTTNGVNKNAQITVSGSPALVWHGTAAWNASQAVRATIASTSDWIQFEVTVSAMVSELFFGFCNTTDNLNGSSIAPGRNTNNGWAIDLTSAQIFACWNSGGNFPSIQAAAGIAANGDVFTLGYKKSTNTAQLFRTRSGSTVQIGSDITGLPSGPFATAFMAAKNEDGGTCNFGGSAFSKTIAGAVMYG